jgi:excisionase family DNA binding protein
MAIDLKWVPVSSAAKSLGVSRQRIYQLTESGLLTWCKIGSVVLISNESINARMQKIRRVEK